MKQKRKAFKHGIKDEKEVKEQGNEEKTQKDRE